MFIISSSYKTNPISHFEGNTLSEGLNYGSFLHRQN